MSERERQSHPSLSFFRSLAQLDSTRLALACPMSLTMDALKSCLSQIIYNIRRVGVSSNHCQPACSCLVRVKEKEQETPCEREREREKRARCEQATSRLSPSWPDYRMYATVQCLSLCDAQYLMLNIANDDGR